MGQEATSDAKTADWVTGENVSLGELLYPHLHFNSIYGGSSGEAESFASGHHDPRRGRVECAGI
jgi:hypothetical protein